mmetsp:Transcript_32990/g.42649  ORF Transcript_32990/g.42649 Transcript_32990/m.42649 type:complete len:143 (+) Transcript_32990:781-1209(+)
MQAVQSVYNPIVFSTMLGLSRMLHLRGGWIICRRFVSNRQFSKSAISRRLKRLAKLLLFCKTLDNLFLLKRQLWKFLGSLNHLGLRGKTASSVTSILHRAHTALAESSVHAASPAPADIHAAPPNTFHANPSVIDYTLLMKL